MVRAVDNSCRTQQEQMTVLNCVRLLARVLPYIFEDPEWQGFFWTSLPDGSAQKGEKDESTPLAHSLLNAVSDLLFCPDFTVASKRTGPDKAEDLQSIDSCEYIWESGVGFAQSPPHYSQYDSSRTELLKLLLTCFSETMYHPPTDLSTAPNKWVQYFTSSENRHALPIFTSLLNTVCAYDPVGLGLPYNHLLFADSWEPLVDVALQILIVALDHDVTTSSVYDNNSPDNLFINYLSRIHRDEDFGFVLRGFTRLLNNPLAQTYLPNSSKKIQSHQELLVFFWKFCDYNKKFLYYVLKSSDVLQILVPILYHLNDSRADQSRVGLMHIGVFIILLLSGERNFGVRLNKPYTATIPMDIPVFTGTHADLLITVFHKIITTGHQRLQPLFDCLLTILVNVSPYLKTLSMVASTKLLHLLEAFSTPWFLFSSPNNHHLVFFLLEIFNNIIQYQFDGNSNLVYTIIRKRQVFHSLASLPSDGQPSPSL
uniref:Protein HID1 n=2 Tax=Lygus hesperus TaxID=30085 RepID=A0A0A9Z9P0_LYGHE